jgi:hypothetical protein
LQNMTNSGMDKIPLHNLLIFRKICKDSARSAVLVMMMWDKLSNYSEGEQREQILEELLAQNGHNRRTNSRCGEPRGGISPSPMQLPL